MATHSSVLAWRIPGTGGAWWAAVYGVTLSRTRLKRLSSSSSSSSSSSVKFSCSVVSDSLPPHELQHTRFPSRSPLKPMSIESVMPSNHLILSHPHLILPSIFPNIRVFSNMSAVCSWPKFWSFIFNISPTNGHPGLIFRMDWLDLLAVQGTLKSLPQHHGQKHQFFGAQLSL